MPPVRVSVSVRVRTRFRVGEQFFSEPIVLEPVCKIQQIGLKILEMFCQIYLRNYIEITSKVLNTNPELFLFSQGFFYDRNVFHNTDSPCFSRYINANLKNFVFT